MLCNHSIKLKLRLGEPFAASISDVELAPGRRPGRHPACDQTKGGTVSAIVSDSFTQGVRSAIADYISRSARRASRESGIEVCCLFNLSRLVFQLLTTPARATASSTSLLETKRFCSLSAMTEHGRHYLANSHNFHGAWTPPSSSANFCEEDYDITRYIAEFMNSLTNLAYSNCPFHPLDLGTTTIIVGFNALTNRVHSLLRTHPHVWTW